MATDSIPPLKRCFKCKQHYPATLEFFSKSYVSKDRLRRSCKHCEHLDTLKPPIAREGYRICTSCKNEFPATLEYFKTGKHSRGGLRSQCRQCNREWQRGEKNSQYAKNWQKAHPDRYIASKDKQNERAKVLRRLDPETARERGREQGRKWRETHPGYNPPSKGKWEKEHPERAREISRNKKRKHPEWATVSRQKRRSRERVLPELWSIADWRVCLEYWNGRCAVCGRPTGLWHRLAQDHWIPMSDTRADNPGTVPWNMLPLCHGMKDAPIGEPSCNLSKGNKDPVKWLISKLGECKAKEKLAEIETYFELMKTKGGE